MDSRYNDDMIFRGKKIMKKALIAMSGGVDSSVAAAIMQDRGYECVGVAMKLYD